MKIPNAILESVNSPIWPWQNNMTGDRDIKYGFLFPTLFLSARPQWHQGRKSTGNICKKFFHFYFLNFQNCLKIPKSQNLSNFLNFLNILNILNCLTIPSIVLIFWQFAIFRIVSIFRTIHTIHNFIYIFYFLNFQTIHTNEIKLLSPARLEPSSSSFPPSIKLFLCQAFFLWSLHKRSQTKQMRRAIN